MLAGVVLWGLALGALTRPGGEVHHHGPGPGHDHAHAGPHHHRPAPPDADPDPTEEETAPGGDGYLRSVTLARIDGPTVVLDSVLAPLDEVTAAARSLPPTPERFAHRPRPPPGRSVATA